MMMELWSLLKSTIRNVFRNSSIGDQLDDKVHVERIPANMSASKDEQTSPIKSGGVKQIRNHRTRTPTKVFWQDARFGLRHMYIASGPISTCGVLASPPPLLSANYPLGRGSDLTNLNGGAQVASCIPAIG